MNLLELETFNLSDAIHFHDELNTALWAGDKLREDVREQLLLIANDFIEHLGLHDLAIEDITISGSNASYSYTEHSDIDLHILVDLSEIHNDDVYRELFDAKKNIYNSTHDILINGYEVELYVQDSNHPVISNGEYSVKNDAWIKLPRKRRARIDHAATKLKYEKLYHLAKYAIKTKNVNKIQHVMHTIKKYRKAGLAEHGEFGPENLAFKILRQKGVIEALRNKFMELHDDKLSLPESSGYIPSEKEKNDPRFKTALTVDIHPDTMQKNARRLGSKISRAGIPPLLRP
jgi:hypothetical protein